jgi:hypothetical protein
VTKAILLMILVSGCRADSYEPRGRTTPDDQGRFHSLCMVSRPPFYAWGACRIEDAPRAGFENFYRIGIMSPLMRLDVPKRFEAVVTVAALPEGRMRVSIAGWGDILMLPLDAEIREAQRRASQVATKDGAGFEAIRQGVTIQAAGDHQYTIVFDHVGRGW